MKAEEAKLPEDEKEKRAQETLKEDLEFEAYSHLIEELDDIHKETILQDNIDYDHDRMDEDLKVVRDLEKDDSGRKQRLS